MTPEVSVVMTVLNEARHLTDSVQRILAQQYGGDIELVIAPCASVPAR